MSLSCYRAVYFITSSLLCLCHFADCLPLSSPVCLTVSLCEQTSLRWSQSGRNKSDYGGKDLWKRWVLSLEWKVEGVTDGESVCLSVSLCELISLRWATDELSVNCGKRRQWRHHPLCYLVYQVYALTWSNHQLQDVACNRVNFLRCKNRWIW